MKRILFASEGWSFSYIHSFQTHNLTSGVLWFTFLQATLSTLLTIIIGLPLAWILARYHWKKAPLMRAILTMPFVTPTIVAAMGFLAIIGRGGLNLIGNEDYRFMALILAHAWFNIALIIRFVEPVISRVHPSMEEQLRFSTNGKDAVSEDTMFLDSHTLAINFEWCHFDLYFFIYLIRNDKMDYTR